MRGPGPVGRFFSSLANALIDLGLPTIRQWLRDRLGPLADVSQVTSEGSLVHLDGVRIPIGPRGLVVLDRATAVITALGRTGLPEMRLHAFHGELVFGVAPSDGAPTFRAELSFEAASDPEEAAWIWGELSIPRAAWTAGEGSPPMNPMHGKARLYVSSREWRLDHGRLDGEIVRAHFAGSGVFEGDDAADRPPEAPREARADPTKMRPEAPREARADPTKMRPEAPREALPRSESPKRESVAPAVKPLVPRALSSATLKLEHARVGPFVDAASGLVGKAIAIPSFVPQDAQLDGDLAWALDAGGRADLRIASDVITAHVRGAISPTGVSIDGAVDATVKLAELLRKLHAPPATLPRDEDVVSVALAVGGALRAPEIRGTAFAPELGFRLGRARFVPPVFLRSLHAEVFVKDDRAVLRAEAMLRGSKAHVDVDANVPRWSSAQTPDPRPNGLSSMRGTLRANAIEPAFLRDLVATLGTKILVPNALTADVDVVLEPSDPARAAPVLSGAVTLHTAASKLTLSRAKDGAMRAFGRVTTADVLETGVFANAGLYPSEGDLEVSLDVDRDEAGAFSLRGGASSKKLALKLRTEHEIPPWVLEDATVDVTLDERAFVYRSLRFAAYGGSFAGFGTIPLAAAPPRVPADRASTAPEDIARAPRLSLDLGGGGIGVASALLPLLATSKEGEAARPRVIAAPEHGEATRSTSEYWIPRDIGLSASLLLDGAGSWTIDVHVVSPRGTELDAAVRIHDHGSVEGSALTGIVAVEDLVRAGALGDAPIEPSGLADVDAVLHESEEHISAAASVSIDRVGVLVKGTPIVLTNVSAMVHLTPARIVCNQASASLYGGKLSAHGFFATEPASLVLRVSSAALAVHELPAIDGKEPAAFVRGYLSGSSVVRWDAGGMVAAGSVLLDAGTFPAISLTRPMLDRYGLRPPNEDASAPATATIVGNDWGISLRNITIDLRGASVRGEVGLSREQTLDGRVEVTLEEDYLRTSRILTLPRALTERLVIPVTIGGPLASPDVRAEVGETLGRFLKDNRVRQLVESAVEEAQILLGRHPIDEARSGPTTPSTQRTVQENELDAALRTEIGARSAIWTELERRRGDRPVPSRLRVG